MDNPVLEAKNILDQAHYEWLDECYVNYYRRALKMIRAELLR